MTEEAHSKTLLVAFIERVKRLEDERAELAADAAEVCKEAKTAGYEPTKIREVVRWLRKIDKHGREKMDEAEAIYDLYRSAIDGKDVKFGEIMDSARDRALLAVFAGGDDDQVADAVHKRRKGVAAAVALAKAAREARKL